MAKKKYVRENVPYASISSHIDEEPKDSILLRQRKCEDALYSLLVRGARRPVRHLASVAVAKIIKKGDLISIYSRASTLEGFLSDGKKNELPKVAGFLRQGALYMLQNASEGSVGSASASAEAYRVIMRIAVGDKSFSVKTAAARCLIAFASIGGPGLGVNELDNSASYCVKALEDPILSVCDAFAEVLGAILALGLNPEAHVFVTEAVIPIHYLRTIQIAASGPREKEIRVGLTLSWVFFLQAIRLRYLHPDTELEHFTLQTLELLRSDTVVDAQALLESTDASPSMKVAALRTLLYALKTLGEVPLEFKEVLDNTLVAALSHSSSLVRVEAALTMRALAEVDPTCVGGLISYGVTTLSALRESVSFGKGSNFKSELDSLHGQATLLAALVFISPKLPLGYPTRCMVGVEENMRDLYFEMTRAVKWCLRRFIVGEDIVQFGRGDHGRLRYGRKVNTGHPSEVPINLPPPKSIEQEEEADGRWCAKLVACGGRNMLALVQWHDNEETEES